MKDGVGQASTGSRWRTGTGGGGDAETGWGQTGLKLPSCSRYYTECPTSLNSHL